MGGKVGLCHGGISVEFAEKDLPGGSYENADGGHAEGRGDDDPEILAQSAGKKEYRANDQGGAAEKDDVHAGAARDVHEPMPCRLYDEDHILIRCEDRSAKPSEKKGCNRCGAQGLGADRDQQPERRA